MNEILILGALRFNIDAWSRESEASSTRPPSQPQGARWPESASGKIDRWTGDPKPRALRHFRNSNAGEIPALPETNYSSEAGAWGSMTGFNWASLAPPHRGWWSRVDAVSGFGSGAASTFGDAAKKNPAPRNCSKPLQTVYFLWPLAWPPHGPDSEAR